MKSYESTRNELKLLMEGHHPSTHSRQLKLVEEAIPMRIAKRPRNKINNWILQTLQFTKAQRTSSERSYNNLLLFLFRLLTIEYRIAYPMPGRSSSHDTDPTHDLQTGCSHAVQYRRCPTGMKTTV